MIVKQQTLKQEIHEVEIDNINISIEKFKQIIK